MHTQLYASTVKPASTARAVLGGLLALLILLMTFALPAGPADAADSAVECRTWHVVRRGETLYRIGLKYNLTWDRIAAANGLANANRIYAGQRLCIPVTAKPAPDVVLVLPTDVQYVMTLTDVNLRVGPGLEFSVMGKIFGGQTAKVTGISANGLWWRVICPSGAVGNCWVSAHKAYTQPTTG